MFRDLLALCLFLSLLAAFPLGVICFTRPRYGPTAIDKTYDIVVPDPTVQQLDVDIEELSTEDPEGSDPTFIGGSTGAFMAIGGGGGGSGAFGSRRGNRSHSNANTVLGWLKRHQDDDGRWDLEGYPANCRLSGPRCEPGRNRPGGNLEATAFALLVYLGAGYDHKFPNAYQRTIKRGLAWLLERQGSDGGWGELHRVSAACTMTLAEAYAMTMDASLREPAQRATDHLLAAQNPGKDHDGSGWSVVGSDPTRNDSITTLACLLALKSAKAGGLDTGNGLEGVKWWLEQAWRAANPGGEFYNPYDDFADFPVTYDEVKDTCAGKGMSTFGGVAAVFLGWNREDVLLATLANDAYARHYDPSRTWPTDAWLLWLNQLLFFQTGGQRWHDWYAAVRKMGLESQRQDGGCFGGSWDPAGAGGTLFERPDRLLVTAHVGLSLQVYYRSPPLAVR